ncbi:MAG: class I SAM-dependent methyltransferase [Verrucomicrobiales bacterium]|nr:class I SAM-dependent methyltransferase [Verrucomicrobiales bacterium]
MSERYDSTAARHYAAFRPPLHPLILARVISPHESFRVGLDVGCGTGHSAVALTRYCDQVLGLEPSRAMLEVAQRHPKVSYHQGSGDALADLPVQAFGVVTFAGSLFYAKTERLHNELLRVCPVGGTIVAYDFEVLVHEVMANLGTECPPVASEYDHRANLSDWPEFRIDGNGNDRVGLDVAGTEMAHLLLADSNRYEALVRRFPNGDPFVALVGHLEKARVQLHVDADIFFTRYRILGGG